MFLQSLAEGEEEDVGMQAASSTSMLSQRDDDLRDSRYSAVDTPCIHEAEALSM